MVFAPADATAFRLLNAALNTTTGRAEFNFLIDGPDPRRFTEVVEFAVPDGGPSGSGADLAERVLPVLGAVLGLSYFKVAAPARFEILVPGVTDAGVEYLRALVREGLAEFAYRAGMAGPLEPEILAETVQSRDEAKTLEGPPLVPIGGGKDSVVSVESLIKAGLEPVQFAVNPNTVIRSVAKASGRPFVAATRTIDPALLGVNAEGALNGHVPVTAFNSLIALVQSALLGLGPVVMSNESSASDPTLTWNGAPVNHQWSKSLDAEVALIAMLRDQAGLVDSYFSLLRPFSELRIARAFSRITGYDGAIVSCNRAFRLGASPPTWCGDCPKCRFVFLAFSPYMEPERLIGIVGSDLFADPDQVAGFGELIGLGEHKPFECVGEEAESTVALSLAARRPEWRNRPVLVALLAAVPELEDGDSELENLILADSAAVAIPEPYERARHALA